MPIKLTNKTAGSPVPERIGFYQMVVSRIEHGSVKPADLVVAFTEGTEVVDAIKGVGFIADPRGNPARAMPLAMPGMDMPGK